MNSFICRYLLFLTFIFGGMLSVGLAQNSAYESVLRARGLVEGQPHESVRFEAGPSTELSVVTATGNIEIFGNPRIDYVQIDLYVKEGFSFWSGGSDVGNFRLIFQEQGDKLIATVEPKRGDSRVWQNNNISFSYVVQVPTQLSSRIRSTRGDIYARNLNGEHLLQVTAGNLFIEGLTGEVRAFSASGNITANDVWGDFSGKTTNGNISLEKAEGEIRLRTTNGNLYAREIMGTFIAATTNGTINAELQSIGEGSYIETVNGAISLTLPPDPNYAFDLSGSGLNIADLLQSGAFEGNVNRNSAELHFGDGSIPVQVSSLTGRITIQTSRN
ncbi:MAG: DUF4097 family beta strand repeat-containing protein [Cyclonatronaceae bacterium]